jgi:tetratricopeptide (TPR) repeat protein
MRPLTSLLLLFLLTWLRTTPSGSAAESARSWKGKQVMPKRAGVRLYTVDEDGRSKDLGELTRFIYTVEADVAGKLRVRQRGAAGYLDKRDAVVLEDAVAYFTARIRANAKDTRAYSCRGLARYERGEYGLALEDHDRAIRLAPRVSAWHNNRGASWQAKGEHDKALADFSEAIRLSPDFAAAYNNRGVSWAAKKERRKALADFNEAVRLDPEDALAHNNRAWLWATSPDAALRDGKRAVESARRACELSGWRAPGGMDTLAAAYAEAGEFREAVRWQKKALGFPAFARRSGEAARQRLALYEKGQPYREK